MTNYLHYKRHLAVLDADDTDIESWITVRGNHIPIKKGQSKEDAVKSFLESKGSKSSNQVKKQSTPELTKGQVRMYRDIDDRYVIVDPDGSYTFWKNGKKGGQNRSLNRFEGAINELESIGYKRAHNLNEMSKKEESKPESSKSEKQGSLKEKMQKIIQRNGKVYGWETEGLEKFAENVEGKSIEQLKELHKAYKDRVAKLGMWVDTPTKLQEQFLGEVIEEQSKSESKTSNPNGTEEKSKTESKDDPRPKNADWETVNDVLFSKYVPKQGKADTLLGEQLRAINKIVYRYENDGDMYGNGYGVETVNAPIKFLQSVYQEKSIPGLSGILSSLKNAAKTNDTMEYEHNIQRLKNVMVKADWETLKKLANTKNDEDMYSFEDNTRYDDDEEEW